MFSQPTGALVELIQNFNIPPRGSPSGIWTFEIAVGEFSCPWDKIAGQMPGHVERFVFKYLLPRDKKK